MWSICGLLVLSSLCTLTFSSPIEPENEVDHAPVVQTENGPVDGLIESLVADHPVHAYYGIPYAQPPTGQNRFKHPLPLSGHSDETFHAIHKPVPCFQNPPADLELLLRQMAMSMVRPFSEDCLKLNIWVPSHLKEKAKVMVYIHGGGFTMGSSLAGINTGAILAANENIIVVSFNYRLGVFGFLTTGTSDAPGNAGLMDQQLALKWIHANIAAFGGDPDEITLFGTSAGSSSIGYHLLSPGSKGLFKRGIMMSGTPTDHWAIHQKSKVIEKSKTIARYLGHKGPAEADKILAYIREQDPEDIVSSNHVCNLMNEDILGPTIDGVFITDHPHRLLDQLANDTAEKVEIMIGGTADEGGIFLLIHDTKLFTRYADGGINVEEFKGAMMKMSDDIDYRVAGAIVGNYIDHRREGDPHMIRDAAKQACGDYIFNCDIEEFADHLAEKGHKVHRYIFDGQPPLPIGLLPKWMGAIHGIDMGVVFGLYLDEEKFGNYSKFNREIMARYGNFAKTGDPNVDHAEFEHSVNWPEYHTEDREVIVLRTEHSEVVKHPGVQRCAVMRHLVPHVAKVGHYKPGEDHCESKKLESHHAHHDGHV